MLFWESGEGDWGKGAYRRWQVKELGKAFDGYPVVVFGNHTDVLSKSRHVRIRKLEKTQRFPCVRGSYVLNHALVKLLPPLFTILVLCRKYVTGP